MNEVSLATADLAPDGSRCLWRWCAEHDAEDGATLLGGFPERVRWLNLPDGDGTCRIQVKPARNLGHGKVFPRPDGYESGCPGPPQCRRCAQDLSLLCHGEAPA